MSRHGSDHRGAAWRHESALKLRPNVADCATAGGSTAERRSLLVAGAAAAPMDLR
jgi:hypothetical protein